MRWRGLMLNQRNNRWDVDFVGMGGEVVVDDVAGAERRVPRKPQC